MAQIQRFPFSWVYHNCVWTVHFYLRWPHLLLTDWLSVWYDETWLNGNDKSISNRNVIHRQKPDEYLNLRLTGEAVVLIFKTALSLQGVQISKTALLYSNRAGLNHFSACAQITQATSLLFDVLQFFSQHRYRPSCHYVTGGLGGITP